MSSDIKKGQICILLMKITTKTYPLDFSHCSNHSSTDIEDANSSGSGSNAISLQYENILALIKPPNFFKTIHTLQILPLLKIIMFKNYRKKNSTYIFSTSYNVSLTGA